MPDICVNVPTSAATRVMDAVCARHGFSGGTTQERAAFVKRWIAESLRAEVRAHEGGQAGEAARIAAETAANEAVVIT